MRSVRNYHLEILQNEEFLSLALVCACKEGPRPLREILGSLGTWRSSRDTKSNEEME